MRRARQKICDDGLVFMGTERACCIHKESPGTHLRAGSDKDFSLTFCGLSDVIFACAPLEMRRSPPSTGSAARGIDEYAVVVSSLTV